MSNKKTKINIPYPAPQPTDTLIVTTPLSKKNQKIFKREIIDFWKKKGYKFVKNMKAIKDNKFIVPKEPDIIFTNLKINKMNFDKEKFTYDLKIERIINKDISLRDASKEIGVSPATLSRIENGGIPTIKVFGLVIGWMLRDANDYFTDF